MAWLVGQVSEQELAALVKRGWEVMKAPASLVCKEPGADRTVMFYVERDLFEVMSGPDWTQNDE